MLLVRFDLNSFIKKISVTRKPLTTTKQERRRQLQWDTTNNIKNNKNIINTKVTFKPCAASACWWSHSCCYCCRYVTKVVTSELSQCTTHVNFVCRSVGTRSNNNNNSNKSYSNSEAPQHPEIPANNFSSM